MSVPSASEAAVLLIRPSTTPAVLAEIATAYPDLRGAVPEPQVTAGPTGRQGGVRAPRVVAAVATVVALAAVGALVVGGSGGGLSVSEQSSATPEEAATFMAEKFAAGQLDDAATAFATTSMVDGYSFTAYAERQQSVSPNTALPPQEAYRTVSLAGRVREVGGSLILLTRSALMPAGDPTSVYSLSGSNGLSAAEFEAALDPAGFASLSLVRIDVLDKPAGTQFAANKALMAAHLGSAGHSRGGVLFQTAEGTAALSLQVIEYDAWCVFWPGDGILATGYALGPMTNQEYEDMISSAQTSVAGS